MHITSKLPNLGTTIFTVMSNLANEHQAINLSQGFPNFDCDPILKDKVAYYVNAGYNQYCPMTGLPALVETLSEKINYLNGVDIDPSKEMNITSGATQAIFSAIHAFVHPGDEVIIIEPAYDCYKPSIELAGGKAICYEIKSPDWQVNWDEFGSLITDKTRMIMINTPHNPTGSTFSHDDFLALQQLVSGTDILILSDEVYEHMVFDGKQHHTILSYPALRKRSMAVYSFGKTLHATGWKLGYIVSSEAIMREFRKVHQFDVFTSNTPMQYAIADYLKDRTTYENLSSFFQPKRDLFCDLLGSSSFQLKPSAGTYFQVADFSAISTESDTEFAKRMTIEYGVAVIPISVFYSSGLDNKIVRFCFAKTDDMLQDAAEKIRSL